MGYQAENAEPGERFLSTQSASSTFRGMKTIKARVQNGKIVGEAPAGLPDGTQLELRIVDPDEELTDSELAELKEILEASWREAQAGHVVPASEVVDELLSRGK